MSAEAGTITDNPVVATILYIAGFVIGLMSLDQLDMITAISLRFVSAIALIGGLIASWKKIITQIKEWLNIT